MSKAKTITTEPEVAATGGELDGMVMALVEAAFDKEESVRDSIREALVDLGKKQPPLVLSSCEMYLIKHKKLVMGHRVVLLNAMRDIVEATASQLVPELGLRLARLGITEMVSKQEIVPEWQTAASALIVSVGRVFGRIVLDELTERFKPGVVPHYYVIKTMGDFASQNSFAVVPSLEDILSRCLPMLGMVKHDNMRWVFTTTLARFSEAIVSYVANIDRAADKTITTAKFSQSVYSAFEVLFNVWLNAKEPKLRLSVVEALGVMSYIVSREKLAGMIDRIIPAVLALYKKAGSDMLPITLGLQMILDSACKDGDEMLSEQLDGILNGLYPLLQYVPDYTDPPTVKNYNEMLRCFEKLCLPFSDRLMAFLFLKMETKEENSRVGTLNVLKHLVNSCDDALKDKRELVVSGLRPLLMETSLKLRQALAQLIITMAHHDYLRLEGGDQLVKFIVDQCSIQDVAVPPSPKGKKNELDSTVTPLQLRSMCDNILQLATTTVSCMELVLWPYLLEFIVPAEYTEAIPTVCMCLSSLATKLRNEDKDDYFLDYAVQVNIPRPEEVLARLLVLLGHPLHRERGVKILALLEALGPNIHEDLDDMLEEVCPRLVEYIKTHTSDEEGWNQSAWEDLVLKFLSRSLDTVDDEEWVVKIGTCFGRHYSLYNGLPDLKNMTSKCLGVVLRKSTNKAFIDEHMDLLFGNVDHNSQVEREGCARGYGFAASTHLDQVIEHLDKMTKAHMVRRSSGFLGLVKDKSESEVARIKSTVMLCHGFVTLYAPPNLIQSRIEVNILASINPHFANVRELAVKENLIRCVDLIGKSLHPSHLKTDKFVFHRRGDLLGHMMAYIRVEPTTALTSETRALAIDACTTLAMLEPKLKDADLYELVDTVTVSVFELPDVPEDATAEIKELYTRTRKSVDGLLGVLISKDTTATCLQNLFKHIARWMNSPKPHQRTWMASAYLSLLNQYKESFQATAKEGLEQGQLEGLGKFLADLVPRCTDPELAVRKDSLGCVQTLLSIQNLYLGKLEADVMIDAITKLQERSEKSEPAAQFAVVNDLSKVLGKKLEKQELLQFLYPLLDALLDKEADSASGACVVANGIFRLRGPELEQEVDPLINAMHEKMSMIEHERTNTGVLRGLRTLSVHHLELVVTKLLSFELPYDKYVVDSWHTLAMDDALAPRILDFLLDALNTGRPYEEKHGKKGEPPVKSPAVPAMKATCAMRELFAVEETEALAKQRYPEVFACLMLRVGSCVGVSTDKKGPVPMDDALDAFKEFLSRTDSRFVFDALDDPDLWSSLSDEFEYTVGLTAIARAMCVHAPKQVPKLVPLMEVALKKVYDTQRVVAAACYAEFINQRCAGDLSLIEGLKLRLLEKLVDPSHVVRMLCIRGLGNVASLPDDQIARHATTVLSAMMAGMDDRDDPHDDITLEAMKGLSKILPKLEEDNVRSILINISLRIRPCFEKEKTQVRAAAIILFGNLSRFGDGPSRVPFLEQIHANVISLLLHLNDPELEPRAACKQALRQLSPLLESAALDSMCQTHLVNEGALHYGEFVNDLSKILIKDFPDKINFYTMNCVSFFRSDWKEIKANAAMLAGFLLGNLPTEQHKLITKEHVCGELIRLLKDPAVVVRQKAAEAMSLLYHF